MTCFRRYGARRQRVASADVEKDDGRLIKLISGDPTNAGLEPESTGRCFVGGKAADENESELPRVESRPKTLDGLQHDFRADPRWIAHCDGNSVHAPLPI